MLLRLEVGPRDIAADRAVVVRRDTREKRAVPLAILAVTIETLLAEMQSDLFRPAKLVLDEHTAEVERYEELAARVTANVGWSLAHWCGSADREARVKAETKATIRYIPRDLPVDRGVCVVCGGSSNRRAIFARAY